MNITALTSPGILARPHAGTASDGDSAAVEAAESSATKQMEKTNGGFAPKTASPLTSASPVSSAIGSINKLV